MDGYKTLKAGQSVQFEAEPGPKGLHACKIQAVVQSLQDAGQELHQPAELSNLPL
jgi:CspA family cold shock protein